MTPREKEIDTALFNLLREQEEISEDFIFDLNEFLRRQT